MHTFRRQSLLLTGLTSLSILLGLAGCSFGATPTPVPTPTIAPSPTATVAPTPTPRASPVIPLPGNPNGTSIIGGGPPSGTTILPRPSGTLPILGGGPPTPGAVSAGAVAANSDGSCPETHPVKAARIGKTYHLKDDPSYSRVPAEECFISEADAQAAGYRHALR